MSTYCHQITSQAAEFKGQGHLKKDKSCDLFLALNLITGNSDRPQFLFMGQQARRNLWEQWAFAASYFFIYRGSLPNATFVSGKNSYQQNICLMQSFDYFIRLLRFALYKFWAILFHQCDFLGKNSQKNCNNEIKQPKICMRQIFG